MHNHRRIHRSANGSIAAGNIAAGSRNGLPLPVKEVPCQQSTMPAQLPRS
jgi:hypothetical protein